MADRLRERPAADATTVRSRRAFARRQRARRWLRWKYVVLALLLVALVAGAAWLLFFSRVLAVQSVEVAGESSLSPTRIREVAEVPEGEPLALVDMAAVEARVQALAEVRDASITRRWPDTVAVEVEERTPVAVVEIGGQLRALDVEGVAFSQRRSAPAGLPRVETPADISRDALREAAAVVSALPGDIARRVDHVEVTTVDQISLALRGGRTVLWGSAEQSELKAEVLTRLLKRHGRTYDVFDVSAPGYPTFR